MLQNMVAVVGSLTSTYLAGGLRHVEFCMSLWILVSMYGHDFDKGRRWLPSGTANARENVLEHGVV
jgi:hypothetical protein